MTDPASPAAQSAQGAETQRILLVCLGNICRSPTAEVVLRTRTPPLKVR